MSSTTPQRSKMLLVLVAVAVFGAAMFVLGRVTAPESSAAGDQAEVVATTTSPATPTARSASTSIESTSDPAEPTDQAQPTAPPVSASVVLDDDLPPGCEPLSDYRSVPLSELPAEAYDTIGVIADGPPYPYRADGGVFQNREGNLPDRERGYYHEFTVETPGSDDRGARRIVTGDCGEFFYTADHYDSFELIDVER